MAKQGGERLLLIAFLFGCESIFTACNFLARLYLRKLGFHPSSFLKPWFLAHLLMYQTATIGQLYIFTRLQLGKTTALFGVIGIVVSNLLGILFLNEFLSPLVYLGVGLAVLALIVMVAR
ncbi:MAG: hypothetical protein ACREN8_04330 [Candidatus Dormibacteraceae bacterium]